MILTALTLATALGDAPGPTAPHEIVERSVYLMGTRLEVSIQGATREAAIAGSEAAIRALADAEARLTTWSDDSELAALNRSPVDEPFRTTPELWRELRAAVACNESTRGGFDPSVGPLLEAWGVREGGRRPSTAEIELARAAVGLDALELGPDRIAVRRRAELVLEEGGFGKGAGLDRAIERIAHTTGVTSAHLDLGGQVAIWTSSSAAVPPRVEVAVADPGRRRDPVIAIAIESGSISTTGNSERGLAIDGQRFSHVLDPSTGMPAAEIGSVTVWAPTALDADCLSTGLYVLGLEGIERWAEEHPEIGILVLRGERANGKQVALASAALRGRVATLSPELDLRFWKSVGTEASETEAREAEPNLTEAALALEGSTP